MNPLPSHLVLLSKLRADARDRVLERAALIHEACPGTTWPEADALAYGQEAHDQVRIRGIE